MNEMELIRTLSSIEGGITIEERGGLFTVQAKEMDSYCCAATLLDALDGLLEALVRSMKKPFPIPEKGQFDFELHHAHIVNTIEQSYDSFTIGMKDKGILGPHYVFKTPSMMTTASSLDRLLGQAAAPYEKETKTEVRQT